MSDTEPAAEAGDARARRRSARPRAKKTWAARVASLLSVEEGIHAEERGPYLVSARSDGITVHVANEEQVAFAVYVPMGPQDRRMHETRHRTERAAMRDARWRLRDADMAFLHPREAGLRQAGTL